MGWVESNLQDCRCAISFQIIKAAVKNESIELKNHKLEIWVELNFYCMLPIRTPVWIQRKILIIEWEEIMYHINLCNNAGAKISHKVDYIERILQKLNYILNY
jgi:hypothetical protein